MENGLKRDNEVWSFHNNRGFQHGCQQMHRQTMGVPMHMCNGFPTRKMEQMIMMSLCDVLRISHTVKGRELYKESTTKPWGCCYSHLGVLVQSVWVSHPQSIKHRGLAYHYTAYIYIGPSQSIEHRGLEYHYTYC